MLEILTFTYFYNKLVFIIIRHLIDFYGEKCI